MTTATEKPSTVLDSDRRTSNRLLPPKRKKLRSSALPVFLVMPAVVLMAIITVAPAIYAFVLSFMGRKVTGGLLGGGTQEIFVGLNNYVAALTDSEFWASITRMLTVAVVGVPATLILATVFALCLDAKRARLTGFTRIAIFIPYAVPGVVASLLWGFLYMPATSPIGGGVIDYFGSTTIFFSVANIAVWGVVGFNMIILYTAIRGLPAELYDAAQLDGASELQIALKIKLPLIRPALVMCGLFSVLGALQLFNEPTTLRPLANAITSSWVPLMKVYSDAFVTNNIYQGAASALLLVALTVGATVVVNAVGRRLGKANK
ncbi:carbohydrate ABC transporter permease [Arthrobacter sp. GMC3]|uniref:carbohydrate ABC transporter permease n=1 Tax=Arthrobacter sp. GMC3 TaxID=2058894 RepID=UPI000CE4A77E|nr:sugar ABC transporter permease [Arthrobacter sp. GMC3]